jgi:hypothetical protein
MYSPEENIGTQEMHNRRVLKTHNMKRHIWFPLSEIRKEFDRTNFVVHMGGMSSPHRLPLGSSQDKIIARILDVTPCKLVNILRDVKFKNEANFRIIAEWQIQTLLYIKVPGET